MNAKRIPHETLLLILQAGYEIVCVYGFAGVTLGNLAVKVGMSKSGLFAHFKSIEQIHLALVNYMFDVFRASVLEPGSEAGEGLPRLRETISLWFEKSTCSPHSGGSPVIAGMFEFDDREGPVRAALLRQEISWRQYLRDLIETAKTSGELKADLDSEQFVSELCGIYYNFHVSESFLRESGALGRAMKSIDILLALASAQL